MLLVLYFAVFAVVGCWLLLVTRTHLLNMYSMIITKVYLQKTARVEPPSEGEGNSSDDYNDYDVQRLRASLRLAAYYHGCKYRYNC